MKALNTHKLVIAVLLTAALGSGQAQLATVEAPPSDSVVAIAAEAMALRFVPAEERPFFGTFWEVRATFPCVAAPSPCPPLDPSTPVYAITDHQFLADQTQGRSLTATSAYAQRKFAGMDPAAIQEAWLKEIEAFIVEVQERQAAADLRRAAEMDTLEDSGGGPLLGPLEYTIDDLWLEIVAITNATGAFAIHPPAAEATTGVYDLFMTTNLSPNVAGLNLTNWVWLLRTATGETNLTVTNLISEQAFFRLGTMLDSDNDGLTDAYENPVAHTSTIAPDSDSDGLADALEIQLGFAPLNAYSQDATLTHKDGPWYLSAQEGQSGTRAQLFWVDSLYDPMFGLTHFLLAITGVTSNDNHHIYIQTPTLDPFGTNSVWQHVFFGFGYDDFYDPDTGIHWYETDWFGDVTNAVFAAFDSADRDFDGLQDGYEVVAAKTAAGASSSISDGIADGDVEISGLSRIQRWQYGIDPSEPVSLIDTDSDGLPDWLETYVRFWFGNISVNAWDDTDSDSLPNIVEFEIHSDPTVRDASSYLPPPPSDEHVSVQLSANYTAQDITNEFFVNFGLSSGPLGLGASMAVLPSTNSGAGTAQVQLEIWPLNSHSTYAPFSDDGDPAQGEFQKPDPADGDLYREIVLEATQLAPEIWAKIDKQVLEALSSKTIEYIHAVSLLRIHHECRRIQYYHYLIAQGANQQAMLLRIRRSVSIVHTEITKVTAIHIEYVHRFPNLNWIGRGLRAAGYLATAASWYYNWPDLMDAVRSYKLDVLNQRNHGAADILSSQIQSMLQDLPGLPTWMVIGLDPTIPIFSLNGPLGWYNGY